MERVIYFTWTVHDRNCRKGMKKGGNAALGHTTTDGQAITRL
ncbi:hypothetical protein HMPREF1146_2243 [Prevotella sp. MSX73]|uniref:Uncharacterized protein n=1 Tax=Segatella buccae ATCC 33574 TaxID=873513 RepID=E6K513_9BACT|nr:hypothetical protein HMPREF6485_0674 [Segatella buccae ATCC 33574]EJP27414.1 hypothetical protein HMPREF1146_2243 [Prevotella sp. MSX73]